MRLAVRLGWNLDGELAIYHFKQGLPRWLMEQLTTAEVARGGSVSVNILAKMALQLEAVKKQQFEDQNPNRTSKFSMNRFGDRKFKFKPGRVDKEDRMTHIKCHECGKFGHKARNCESKGSRNLGMGKTDGTTNRNIASSTREGPRVEKIQMSGQRGITNNISGVATCFKCGRSGHMANECVQSRNQERDIRAIELADTNREERNEMDPKFKSNQLTGGIHTPCMVNGIPIMALVDPGAMVSFIDRDLVRENGWTLSPCVGFIRQAMTGSEIPRMGKVGDVELRNGSKSIKVTMEVGNLSGGVKVILGLDLFGPLGYQIRNVPILFPTIEDGKQHRKEKKQPDTDKAVELRNYGIGEDGIPEEWRKVLADNAALPINSTCLLQESELAINTGDNKPVWIRQYPIPQGIQNKVRKRVEEWKSNGWISLAPANCQWNLPLLAAPKPSADGGPSEDIRLCLDGRALNASIVDLPDSNLPGIREVIDKLGSNFQWVTTLDLADNYHQFKIKEEDRMKTAFMSEGLQWMFNVAPFGLRILTGHVQRLMEKHLGPTGRVPFQDDVSIASKSVEEHIKEVKEVLEILTYKLGLRLRLKKCKFFRTEARILGHLVTRAGIQMDPAKVKSILEWPKPMDGKAMQRFMGAANFHRDFSHEFAKIAAPLEECRQQKVIEWTQERESAFGKLKELFGKGIQLNHVNWSKKIYLTTDACQTGIGAWLGQKDGNGDVQPFICASKKLSSTQQRWSTTKRELYALMWAMQRFNSYLLGRNFIARVDHKPLVNLVTNKMSLIMQGWMDNILLYDFTTEYLPGENNNLADALSRSYEGLDDMKVEIRNSDVEFEGNLSETDQQLLWEAEKRGLEMPSMDRREQLVKDQHAMGHFGIESCCQRIQQDGYWWPRMRQDIKREQESCIKCTRFDVIAEGFHPAKSIMADRPWDHVEIDLIGPLPISQNGFTYIFTVVDVCTAYTVIRALKSKEMEVVARKLWEIFTDYGTPKIMQSDNGLEFVNKVVNAMTTLYGIEPRLSAAYNP